jgi:hypothetical protein
MNTVSAMIPRDLHRRLHDEQRKGRSFPDAVFIDSRDNGPAMTRIGVLA